ISSGPIWVLLPRHSLNCPSVRSAYRKGAWRLYECVGVSCRRGVGIGVLESSYPAEGTGTAANAVRDKRCAALPSSGNDNRVVCSVVAGVIERLAVRIHARRAPADAPILFQWRDRFVTIDVTFVPDLSRAVVDHPLPAKIPARRYDDDRAVVILDTTSCGSFAAVSCRSVDQQLGCQSMA